MGRKIRVDNIRIRFEDLVELLVEQYREMVEQDVDAVLGELVEFWPELKNNVDYEYDNDCVTLQICKDNCRLDHLRKLAVRPEDLL